MTICCNVQVVMANCARVTARDILATNGVVHVVDKVSHKPPPSSIDPGCLR